jgi:hypothetical protein
MILKALLGMALGVAGGAAYYGLLRALGSQ